MSGKRPPSSRPASNRIPAAAASGSPTLLYKSAAVLSAAIGVDQAMLLDIRGRINNQCAAMGTPLNQPYSSYPPDAMLRLARDITLWWNAHYGKEELYLSMVNVDAIVHRLCLANVRSSKRRGERRMKRRRMETGRNEVNDDDGGYQEDDEHEYYDHEDEEYESPDEEDDSEYQEDEIDIPEHHDAAVDAEDAESNGAGQIAATVEGQIAPAPAGPLDPPSAAIPLLQPEAISNRAPPQLAMELDAAPTAAPSSGMALNASMGIQVPSPVAVSPLGPPPSAAIPQPQLEPISNRAPPQLAMELDAALTAAPSSGMALNASMGIQVPSPAAAGPPDHPSAAIPPPQLEAISNRAPPQPAMELDAAPTASSSVRMALNDSVGVRVPCPTLETPTPAVHAELTLHLPELQVTLTLPRNTTLPYLVSRLAEYFHHPTRGYTLSTLLLRPAPRMITLTASAAWAALVGDLRTTELNLIRSVWPFPADNAILPEPISAYVSPEEISIAIPRSASLAWVVARVAQWFWTKGEGYTLRVLLPEKEWRMVELRSEDDWKSVCEDVEVRVVVFSQT
ncbi:hypothetical protein FN846DRAFT_920141 [Sphaerosporella brunnea]|uniref:Uncharacterized protein n=1 Tax=Sphaerosporella brunnea TaxID=1250544 RepID=A0A5J5ET29_9PEZI|nr:hypothetical protein FN846DRAFT_920141 [Sphaerosporella brunnea]